MDSEATALPPHPTPAAPASPVVGRRATDSRRPTADDRGGGGGRSRAPRVLCVEDDPGVLGMVGRLLAEHPEAKLVFSFQGRLAVELAFEHAPTVIVLDLRLLECPPEEVLRRLRWDGRTAQTAIVVVADDTSPEAVVRLRAAGADACLRRPVRPDDLAAVLAPLLR